MDDFARFRGGIWSVSHGLELASLSTQRQVTKLEDQNLCGDDKGRCHSLRGTGDDAAGIHECSYKLAGVDHFRWRNDEPGVEEQQIEVLTTC